MKKVLAPAFLLAVGIILLSGCKKDPGEFPPQPGAVFIMDNASSGNHVSAYKRAADGSLSWVKNYATGGTGNNMGLGSQGAITLTESYLYVCNAGSSEITVFSVSPRGLHWVDKVASHGTTPVSITVHDRLLYVLNAGKTSNIAGFYITSTGHLEYIKQSERPLSMADGLAQVSFNATGTQLVVTEKATNTIKAYDVMSNGTPGDAMPHASAGETPFGFAVDQKGHLFVSQAFGGEAGASALSSYQLASNGDFKTVTGPVATHQTAACWVAITGDGKYCYTTNTGSGNISGYSIAADGAVTLLNDNGVTGITGGAPADLSISRDSRYLYTRNGNINTISIFKIHDNGSLTLLGTVTGLPAGAAGLAAR